MYTNCTVTMRTFGSQRKDRPATAADVSIDCRPLVNPMGHVSTEEECRAYVLSAPGFPVLIGQALSKVLGGLRTTQHLDVDVFCLYGRHRSPTVARVLASLLTRFDVQTMIQHF